MARRLRRSDQADDAVIVVGDEGPIVRVVDDAAWAADGGRVDGRRVPAATLVREEAHVVALGVRDPDIGDGVVGALPAGGDRGRRHARRVRDHGAERPVVAAVEQHADRVVVAIRDHQVLLQVAIEKLRHDRNGVRADHERAADGERALTVVDEDRDRAVGCIRDGDVVSELAVDPRDRRGLAPDRDRDRWVEGRDAGMGDVAAPAASPVIAELDD